MCVNNSIKIRKLLLKSLLYLFTSIDIQCEVLVTVADASVLINLGEIVWVLSNVL